MYMYMCTDTCMYTYSFSVVFLGTNTYYKVSCTTTPPGPTTPSQANQHPEPFSTSHPSEIIQHETSKEDLLLIKNESCSCRNFALHQAEKMFEKGEWIGE